MDDVVQIGDKVMKYSVLRRDIKNIRLEIEQNTLEIHIIIPKDEKINNIQKILMENKAWIYKNYCRFEKINREKQKFQLKDGSKLYLLGKEFILNLKIGEKQNIIQDDETITLFYTDKNEKIHDGVKSQLFRWYKKKATSFIKSNFMKTIKKFDFEYNKVFIKDLKTRWGNCTSNKNISYNWKIIFAPPEVINYVILHEIIHLKESNHTTKFWNRIKQECPNFRDYIDWLEKNEQKLLLSFL